MTLALRAELLKIATVRGQWLGAVLAVAAIPIVTLLVVATGGLTATESTTTGAAAASMAGLLAFGTWSATVSAGEYARGTMTVSLSTVPRRSILFVSKLGAHASTAMAGAVVSVALALGVVQVARAPGAYGFGNPGALIGVVLAIVAVVVIGTSLGIITRSPTASVVLVVALLLLPKAASGLLGGLQPWIVGASPATVVAETVGGMQLAADQAFPAGAWLAACTMLFVAALFAALAAVTFFRRDG